ncbi:MFS transporter, partial [bacterium]|nr:MFS transporter [bacterium]
MSFFTDIHSETILALLPQFMANVLGLRKETIGLIEGLADATASVLKILSGWFSDRLGKRKPVVLAGYVISTALKPLLCLATTALHVLGVRIGDRVGKGIRSSARDALVAESVSPEQRGKAFGFHRAMDTAGAAVGTTLAIL